MSKQQIYNLLRQGGLSQSGALAMMGNWQCESGLEANRLQGDFSPFRTPSKNYTAAVSTGAMGKESFAVDQKGYGLAQWTLAYRKRKLWEFWKSATKELDDPIMQTEFALNELTTEGEYRGLYKLLCSSDDLYVCTESVCKQYERPAINNVGDRYSAALNLGVELKDEPVEEEPILSSPNNIHVMPTHEFWPPRVICKGMKGTDVEVMTALLKAREYDICYVTREFGQFVEERLIAFQNDAELKPDGICGPLTWAELLKR